MIELTPAHLRLMIGVGLKSLGYLIIAAGIFLSLKDKALALKVIYIGVSFVIFGWFLMIRALRLARSKGKAPKVFERSVKISAHVSGGFFGAKEGDTVKVGGCVMGKSGKDWKPMDGSVLIALDGIPLGKAKLKDGRYSFLIPNLKKGVYDVHVRFVEGCEEKRIKVKILSREEWKRNVLIVISTILAFATLTEIIISMFLIKI